jgi:hypothetical protein
MKENLSDPRKWTKLMNIDMEKESTWPKDWARKAMGEKRSSKKFNPKIKVKKGIKTTL